MKKNDKATGKLIITIAVFFTLMVILRLIALPYISLLSEPEAQQKFKAWVTSLGVGGVAASFVQNRVQVKQF
ncbi:MAG TPA: hypothetical protein VN456_02520 [Desulfosporosinus sp.]|nr:hypothetical protein [Desulfosporosinus sp.]